MLYYSSSNSSDGSTNITVTFDVSRNQDLAAVDVQNAVKLAEPQLPDAVRTNGITILKANTDILAVVALALERSALRRDVSRELHEALRRRRAEARARRRRRDAVSGARLRDAAPARSGQDGAARHHGDATSPPRCASRTRRIPPGRLGASRRRRGRSSRCRSRRSVASRRRRSSTTSSFARVPMARSFGSPTSATPQLGARSYDLEGRLNGVPTAFALLYTRPGANALAVKEAVVEADGRAADDASRRACSTRCRSTRRRSSARRSRKSRSRSSRR